MQGLYEWYVTKLSFIFSATSDKNLCFSTECYVIGKNNINNDDQNLDYDTWYVVAMYTFTCISYPPLREQFINKFPYIWFRRSCYA